MSKRIIGLDIGTNSVKAMLVEGDKIVASHSVGYNPDFLGGGKVEQDPSVWWLATKDAIKGVLKAHPGDVAAISASGQMHSSVFLDKGGDVIRPAILWNDTRTTEQVKEVVEAVGGQAALVSMVHNKALEGFTLPKTLWLRKNEPANFAKLDKVIMPKDYINYMLTGRIVTDLSDAAGTICMDVEKAAWSDTLMNKLGLSMDILPEAIESTAIVGDVSAALAAELGLGDKTVVVAGGADNSCAAIGNGVVRTGQAVISVGTSGTVVAMLESVPKDLTGDVHLFNYSYPKSFYAMGCMMCAGESLNWLKGLFPVDSFDEYNVMAESSKPGAGDVIFLPYLFGERCPVGDPNAKGIFFGLSNTTSKQDMVRAVFEGVAYNIKAMFEMVEGFAPISEVFITGGGAKSAIWGQIIADVLGRNVGVLNIEEGPAFGAALIAGVGADIYESFDIAAAAFLKTQRIITPHSYEAYSKLYPMFKELYQANKGLFAKL